MSKKLLGAFQEKLEYLLSSENYRRAVEIVDGLDMSQTWEKVTDFHLDLIKEFVQ